MLQDTTDLRGRKERERKTKREREIQRKREQREGEKEDRKQWRREEKRKHKSRGIKGGLRQLDSTFQKEANFAFTYVVLTHILHNTYSSSALKCG